RRHTRLSRDWSSDVCSSDLLRGQLSTVARDMPGGRGVGSQGDSGSRHARDVWVVSEIPYTPLKTTVPERGFSCRKKDRREIARSGGFAGGLPVHDANGFVETNTDQARDALLLHGDAVESIGSLHGELVVRHEDELGVGGELSDEPHEALHVGIIEWGIDLIQNAEWARFYKVDSEEQGNGSEGLLAAGEL